MPETPKESSKKPVTAISETVSENAVDGDAGDRKQPPASALPSKARRLLTAVIVLVVLLIAAAIGLIVSRDLWAPTATPYLNQLGVATPNFLRPNAVPTPAPEVPGRTMPPDPVTILAKRVADLAAEIADLQARQARSTPPEVAQQVPQIAKTVQALGQDLKDLDNRLSAQIQALQTRAVARKEAAVSASAGPAADAAELSRLQTILSDTNNRLDKLEAAPSSDLTAQVSALTEENRSLRLQMQEQADTMTARLATLAAEMNTQFTAQSTVDHASGSRLLAANLLAQASARNGNFEAELAAIAPADLDPQDRAFLSAQAATGVITVAALKTQFSRLLPTLIRAAQVGEDRGFTGQILNRLAEVVEVRRIDGEGDDIDAKIARAEAALGAGELGAAIAALADLPDAAAAAAEPWLTAARTRLTLDTIVRNLQANAVTALQPAKQTGN